MAEHAQRLGERPGREGVGAVALVEHGQRGGVVRVAQVEVKTLERRRGQQALVDDGAAGKTRDVEILDPLALGLVLDLVAADVEFPFELVVTHRRRIGATHEDLLDVGTGPQRLFPEHGRIHRHHAPAENEEFVLLKDRLGDVAAARLGVGIVRQEHHADAEIGILKQVALHLRDLRTKDLVRNLGEDAGAVAGLGIGVHGAAMNERTDAGERAAQDEVAALAVDVGHEADATGIMLGRGIVKSLERFGLIENGLIERHRSKSLNGVGKSTRRC